jgi:hypothetical protein
MTMQSPKNKGQCSSVGPAQPKRKFRPIYTPRKCFPHNSDIECSTYTSGLLTYIIHPCTPSSLASRCQLAPPAPSPLAHELTLRRHCAPRRSLRVPPLPPPPCSLPPLPHSTSHRRQPVSPASPGPLRYARYPPPPPLCSLTPPQSTRVPPPPPPLPS